MTIVAPVTAHGLGFMEGALAFLFSQAGATAEQGLAVALLLRLGTLMTAATGAVFLWRQRPRGV